MLVGVQKARSPIYRMNKGRAAESVVVSHHCTCSNDLPVVQALKSYRQNRGKAAKSVVVLQSGNLDAYEADLRKSLHERNETAAKNPTADAVQRPASAQVFLTHVPGMYERGAPRSTSAMPSFAGGETAVDLRGAFDVTQIDHFTK